MKLTTIGLAIGLALAFAVARLLRSLLPGISPLDPITFVAVPLVLDGDRRGGGNRSPRGGRARVDPVMALRNQ